MKIMVFLNSNEYRLAIVVTIDFLIALFIMIYRTRFLIPRENSEKTLEMSKNTLFL